MSKSSRARYRTTNRSSATAALCRRGSLLIWLYKEMTWLATFDGSPGRPSVFPDAAIQFCLTIKMPDKLPRRQTTGMVASLCTKVLGDGEWQARKHDVQGRRQWRKVDLAMDPSTSDIRSVEFTPGSDGDNLVLPAPLSQVPEGEEVGTVMAAGAYDTRRCHTATIRRRATAILLIRKNGRLWKEDNRGAIARHEALRATRRYGKAIRKR